jgi:hypothetical protein
MGTWDYKFHNKSDVGRKWSVFSACEQLAVLISTVTYKLIIYSMDWCIAYGHYFTRHLPPVTSCLFAQFIKL